MSKDEQYELASKIEVNYACRVIRNECEPYTLYCLQDLGKILNLSNVHKTVCTFNNQDRMKMKTKTNGGEQDASYLTYTGLMRFISRTRSPRTIEFINKIGLTINTQFFSSPECDTLRCIMDAFQNEEMVEQYTVLTYRLDLYFPRYKLAIECDENHHNQFADDYRELKIKKNIPDCVFIRFKPFDKNFNIFKVINQIYQHIIAQKNTETTEGHHVETVESNNTETIEVNDVDSPTPNNIEITHVDEPVPQIQAGPTMEEPDNTFVKRRVHSRSPKVCQYDKTTLELINIYDSIIDVIRKFNSSSPSALKEAAKNRTIYKDYRWMMMDRESTETPVPQPTVASHQKNIEPIAMIDIKQTKILEVYACQRDAASARNLAGFSTISRSIKNKSISSGHYWNFFNQCSQDMRDVYLSERDLPEPHIKTNGNSVIQYDPISNKEIARYHSITEVVKRFQMSPVSLRKYAATGEPHNGFKWKIVKASE